MMLLLMQLEIGRITMEGYGLMELTKNARETQPTALATEFLVGLD
jgi:hypothetical protein